MVRGGSRELHAHMSRWACGESLLNLRDLGHVSPFQENDLHPVLSKDDWVKTLAILEVFRQVDGPQATRIVRRTFPGLRLFLVVLGSTSLGNHIRQI